MAKEINANIFTQSKSDMELYGAYVARNRSVPDFRDGLKGVQRKILFTMFNDFKPAIYSKSSAIVGVTMQKYHPHGDSAIYDSMKPLTNWFEIYKPLIDGQGNWGNFQGDGTAASRYTEARLTKFAIDVLCDDLGDHVNVVDWDLNYTESLKEPSILPAKLPMLLINGCFGIAVGFKTEVPSHNINEVIDQTVALIDNPNHEVVLYPDHNMPCTIIESKTTPFENISSTGYGSYKVRGTVDIGEYKNKPALFIHSLPNMVYTNTIAEKIEDLIKNGTLTQIDDLYENSNGEKLEYIIVLKKGSDPVFVRDVLYKFTQLEISDRVNMDVLNGKSLIHCGYKEYLLNFLAFRKQTKLRLYRNKEQDILTNIHILEFFKIAIETGLADKIITMIRNSSADTDDEIIEYILKELDKVAPDKHYTSTQVKQFINMPIKNFAKKTYKRHIAKLKDLKDQLKIIHPKTDLVSLDSEIREELLELKAKYGEPRRCKVISEDDISDIPKGTFRICITDTDKIKKFGINEPIRDYKGEYITATTVIENTDDLILFDVMGRVFTIPTHKIPLTERGGQGTPVLSLNKKMVSNIAMIIPQSKMMNLYNKQNFTIVVLTRFGYIKKMLLNDFTTVTTGGLIYTKLEPGDYVKSILFIQNGDNNIVIYSDKKALRISSNDIQIIKRNTRGVRSMTADTVDGMSVVSPDADSIIVVTNFGYVNKIDIGALGVKPRGRSGDNIIKLTKGDSINVVYTANDSAELIIQSVDGTINVPVKDIRKESSISKGTKLTGIKNGILNVSLVKK